MEQSQTMILMSMSCFQTVPKTQIQDFAKNNTLEILENNNLIQAIKTDTTFAMNVWGVDGANLEGIGVDRSASVTAHITNNRTLTIAVSDPKHVEEEIQVTITRPYKSVTKMDSNITQNGNQFTINTKDLEGASSIIELRLDTEALENAVVSEIRTLFKTIDALDLDLYTEYSSNDLVETRSRVQETVDNPDRTLEDLEDGRNQLQTSYDHLELKEIQEEPETKPETKPEVKPETKPDVEVTPNIDPSKPITKPEIDNIELETLPKTGIQSETRSFAAFMIIGLGLLLKRKDS
ncbi:polysaccharide lyase beta-sandwich domain-containing protein [Erysipelothrix piscisicarius]|uniref:polysaccharide lyase beta-sandwich domain-containing protein n=1 Tax=Erysipelothrix piscisicarius TaxID=2485784 RepID=UPI002F92D018